MNANGRTATASKSHNKAEAVGRQPREIETTGRATLDTLRQVHIDLENRLAQVTGELQAKSLELKRRNEDLARIAAELIVSEQRERSRLAQLLHDDLQQLLVGARYALQVLAGKMGKDGVNPVDHIMEVLDEAIRASRLLTTQLSPPILQEKGLAAGLQWLAHWMHERHGLEVELTIDAVADADREEIRMLLFQSVRELLFNVVKHAGVKRARVELAMPHPRQIVLTVSDQGAGFDPADIWNGSDRDATGFGLPAIRERLGQLGGRIEIRSAPGRGSRFSMVCPL